MVYISNPIILFFHFLSLFSLTHAATFPHPQADLLRRNGSETFTNTNSGRDFKTFLRIAQVLQADDARKLDITFVQEGQPDLLVTGSVHKNVDGQGISVCTNGDTTPRSDLPWMGHVLPGADIWCFDVGGKKGAPDPDELEIHTHKFGETKLETSFVTSDKGTCDMMDWSKGSDIGSARSISCGCKI